MSALGIVLTKVISKEVEKVIILFYLGVATCCCGTIGLFTFGHPSIPGYEEWLLSIHDPLTKFLVNMKKKIARRTTGAKDFYLVQGIDAP